MASKPEQREQPFAFITRSPYRWQILIGLTTAIALLFNFFSLELGEVTVSNHLLYIPIIIAAYAYPRKGTLFALLISGAYLLMVYGFRSAYPEDLFCIRPVLHIRAGRRCGILPVTPSQKRRAEISPDL